MVKVPIGSELGDQVALPKASSVVVKAGFVRALMKKLTVPVGTVPLPDLGATVAVKVTGSPEAMLPLLVLIVVAEAMLTSCVSVALLPP